MAWVRWRTSKSRVRNTTAAACWFALLRATKRMVGRWAASQDRLRIGHVVLLSLDERLHVRRRDQLHRVAELGDLAAPIMRAATGLHGHRAGRQCGQERQKLAAAQLLAKDHRARAVSPMELKDVFGEIEADGAKPRPV